MLSCMLFAAQEPTRLWGFKVHVSQVVDLPAYVTLADDGKACRGRFIAYVRALQARWLETNGGERGADMSICGASIAADVVRAFSGDSVYRGSDGVQLFGGMVLAARILHTTVLHGPDLFL